MKPSGIEWIGDIPEDWEVCRLKRCLTIQNGLDYKSVRDDNGEFPVIGSGGQFDFASKYLYNGESVLFGRKGTVDKPLYVNGKFWTVDTMFYSMIKPNACGKFIFYAATTIPFNFYSTATAVPSMTQRDLINHYIVLPPLSKQRLIADYLDEKCWEIDATIAKQKESIEKLKAYKQSLISETVTKGLDKSAPLKPSGIEWIGNIPYDWEIRKVKNTGKLIGGSGFPEEYQGVKDEKIPFIKVKSLAEDPISRNGKDSISESIRSKLNAEKFIKGSVVFAKVGAALLLQRFRILEFDSCIDNNMMGFIPLVIEPRFFKYVTILFDFSYFVNPGTVPSINQEQIGNIKIPFPPLKSQEKIADYLDGKCSQIDKYITEKQNIIQKLDAYKKSLIFESITGKQKI